MYQLWHCGSACPEWAESGAREETLHLTLEQLRDFVPAHAHNQTARSITEHSKTGIIVHDAGTKLLPHYDRSPNTVHVIVLTQCGRENRISSLLIPPL